MQHREQAEIQKIIGVNDVSVEIKREVNLINVGYHLIFTYTNGTQFVLARQKRKDRPNAQGVRSFKTLDAAVATLDKLGIKGNVIIRL